MEKLQLGKSDLYVSPVGLGCMGFSHASGDPTADDEAIEMLRAAHEIGYDFYDTAEAYVGVKPDGTVSYNEELVGKAIRDFRDEVVIATKMGVHHDANNNLVLDSRPETIRASCEESLRKLGVDTIDLYYRHSWDYGTPIEESLEALNEAVAAGKVRALGVSNCHPYQLARANDIAAAHGWARFEAIQSHMNLIFREDERELLQLCAEDGISTMPYSALAAGRLSRKPGETSKRLELDTFAKGKYDATAEQDNVIIERVAEMAEKYETSMTAVALAWLLTKVTSPVVGATKPHHLEGPAAAADLVLAPEDIAYLEEPYVPHALVGVMAQRR